MWLDAEMFPPAACDCGRTFRRLRAGSLGPSAALLSRFLPPGSEGGELVVERGEAVDGRRPAVMAALSVGAPPACSPLLVVGGSLDERGGERVLVVGRDEP